MNTQQQEFAAIINTLTLLQRSVVEAWLAFEQQAPTDGSAPITDAERELSAWTALLAKECHQDTEDAEKVVAKLASQYKQLLQNAADLMILTCGREDERSKRLISEAMRNLYALASSELGMTIAQVDSRVRRLHQDNCATCSKA